MKFEIFQSENNEKYYFCFKVKNGQIIFFSQGYVNKFGVKNGIESVKKNVVKDEFFECKEVSNGKFYFNLFVGNK